MRLLGTAVSPRYTYEIWQVQRGETTPSHVARVSLDSMEYLKLRISRGEWDHRAFNHWKPRVIEVPFTNIIVRVENPEWGEVAP